MTWKKVRALQPVCPWHERHDPNGGYVTTPTCTWCVIRWMGWIDDWETHEANRLQMDESWQHDHLRFVDDPTSGRISKEVKATVRAMFMNKPELRS